jgi:membrane protease YdiL (CAAX protease family)
VRDLPPPLPPETRTIGQLVAETIRAYGNNFWRVLPLGVPLAVADQLSVRQTATVQMAVFWALLPLFVGGYLWACRVVLGAAPTLTAGSVAVLIWLPFPALRYVYVLPALAWLAFIGLAVPAAMAERLRFRDALVRGRRLGTADFVHAVGSLATLVIVVGVAANTLSALLHTQGDNGQRVAVFLSDVVLSPLLFVGGALLYIDQAARAVRSAPDAALHPPVDADAAGRADPQVES